MAIDTSGSFCSVAVSTASGLVVHRESDGAGDHFERLPCLAQDVTREAGIEFSQLSELRIGLGPGSFTGLRIGMSFAKGVASAARIPLRGVCSFAGVAHALVFQASGDKPQDIMVISDARRSEVFCSTYEWQGDRLIQVTAPQVLPVGEVNSWQGCKPLGMVVSPLGGIELLGVRGVRVVSRIAEGLLEVEGLYRGAFDLKELAQLEPNYLRAVAAKSIAERTGA